MSYKNSKLDDGRLSWTVSPTFEPEHTRLHEAIAEKNLKGVNKVLREGKVDVNKSHSIPKFGFPLIHAFEVDDKRIMRALLKAGANPNVCDLIAGCVKEDNLSLAKLLIEFGADPNGQPTWEKDGNFETNLIRAARLGRYAFVKLLLEAGADPNVHNADNESAMLVASTNGNDRIARLLKRYASKEEYAWVEERLDDAFEEKLRLQVEIYDAIFAGETEQVVHLLEKSGTALNELLEPEHGAPLEEALNAYFYALGATSPEIETTSLAIWRANYKPNYDDPEVVARRNTVKALLDLGAPVHLVGWKSPLQSLNNLRGCPEDIEIGIKMIELAPDINAPICCQGSTALYGVVSPGILGYSTFFAEELLKRGADPNACDCYRVSILMRARESEKWNGPNPCVPLLLEAGAKE